jgi:C1A family cysteine protease
MMFLFFNIFILLSFSVTPEDDGTIEDPNVITFEIVPCNGFNRDDIEIELEDNSFFHGEVFTALSKDDTILATVDDGDEAVSPLETLTTRVEEHLKEALGCVFAVKNVEHIFSELIPETNMYEAEFRDYDVESASRRSLSAPPTTLDLRSDINGGVRNQGQFGTCVAFSASVVKAYHEKLDYGFKEFISPRFIYAFRKNYPGKGVYLSDLAKILKTKGAITESKMPYSGMNRYQDETSISAELKADGLHHRVSSSGYTKLRSSSYTGKVNNFKNAFKAAMSELGVGIIETAVYNRGCSMWEPTGKLIGYHAMAVVGYTDSHIIIQNSWGTRWCDKGYSTISWADAVKRTVAFYFYKDTTSPLTLKLSESSNWSRRYNQRLRHGWYCSGSKQQNWGGLPNEQVVRYGSLDLEVLDAQKQTYRVVSQETKHGIDFGKGSDCYSWAACGAQRKRGGFSIDLRGTGFEIVSSRVVSSGWGKSMYVSQDGAPHEKSSNFALADGTQRVEAMCGGWCGSCKAELVVRKIPSTWRVSLDGRDLAPGQWTGDGGISYEKCVKRAEAQKVKYFAWTGQVYQPGYCKVLKPGIANPNLSTFQGYGYKLFENVDESCRWVVSSKGRDLQRGQWDGYGYTKYNACVAKADAQGVKFFAWTASVYGGFCKVLKREVRNPNMNTYQGYNYKLYERKCSNRRL